MEKIIILAKKLNALAERGEGGEKLNADKMLKDLMKKHCISLDDIEDPKPEYEIFECKPNQHRIMKQVMYMIMGKDLSIYGHKKKRNALMIECTKSQFVEITATFDFYWKAYEKEIELFTRAFIHKNHILPNDAGECDLATMTPEQIQDLKKIIGMMGVIDKQTLRKQLHDGTNTQA